jgi:hypothetical protein
MDINALLQNDMLKGLLAKAGISPEQAGGVLNTALTTIKGKFSQEPAKMASLLSDNPNTDDDHAMAGSLDNDFISSLASKFGLPSSVTDQLKGAAMPEILKSFSGSLSAAGSNNEGGISSMLSGVMDMFGGQTQKAGGLMGMLTGLFSKFFGKK